MLGAFRRIQFHVEFIFLQSVLEQHVECIVQRFITLFINLVQQRFVDLYEFLQRRIKRRVGANEPG